MKWPFLSDDKHDKMQFWNEANNFSKQSVQLNAIWEPVKKWLAVFCKNRDQKNKLKGWRVGVQNINSLFFSGKQITQECKVLALSVSSVMKPCWMKNTHQSGRIINRMVLNVLFSRKIQCLSELKGKLLEKHLEKDLKMNYRIFLTSTHGDGVLLGCQVCWNLQTVKVRVVDIIALKASAYL